MFEDGTRALRDINLTAKKGEFIVILGPSGSGKTTLLRCINGLVLPNEGTINFAGHSIYSKGLVNLRKKTGMIFQDFNLVENLSSLNNVLTGLLDSSNKLMSIFYMFSREQKLIALECLERVGLLHKAYMRVDQLSGGQKQRVGIARAITKKPLLLLADEPVASLDVSIKEQIMDVIFDLNKTKKGLESEKQTLKNKIGILKNGSLVKEMYSDDVSSRQLESLYLDYMKN